MFKIAVLVSGGGTDFQSIIDAVESGYIKNCSIEMMISSSEKAYAIERAKKHNIATYVVTKKEFGDKQCDKILELTEGKVDLIVLAGFLSILNGELLKRFSNKIINIHPSLIPAFCGPGMYGMKVHEKAIEKGVKFSGCTVHFVNDEVDGGAIIDQEIVPVKYEDRPEDLQKRILEKEHILLPRVVKLLSEEKIKLVDNKVKIEG